MCIVGAIQERFREQVSPVWPAGAYTVLRVAAAETQGMLRLGKLLHMAALGVVSA